LAMSIVFAADKG